MKFDRDTKPTPYLNRKDQYRMLGLVALLTLIIFAIDFTANPKNWEWFFAGAQQQDKQELRELSLDELDFTVPEPANVDLKADEFIAVREDGPTIDVEQLGVDISQIPPELLDGVEDKRVGLLRSEQAAMDRVLRRVETLSESELNQAAANDIGFRVVFTDAEKYRGKLIQIEGTLWRFQKYPMGDPENPEDDLWQAWLMTSDSGNNPWVVFMTEKPAGVEVGQGISKPVRLAGYFFKNYGYATQEGLHVAPMVIAKTMTMVPPPPPVDQKTENLSLYVFIFLLSIGAIFGLMIYWFSRSDKKFNQSHLAEIAESRLDASPEVVADLNKLEAHAPDEYFQARKEADTATKESSS